VLPPWWIDTSILLMYIVIVKNEPGVRRSEADTDSAVAAGHVLLVNYFFPPMTGGGIPRPVKMAKYLQRLGWNVTVLTLEGTGPADDQLSIDDVDVLRVRMWRLDWILWTADRVVRCMRRTVESLSARRSGRQTLLDHGFAYEEQEIASSKIGWVVPATRAALRLHQTSPIDVAVVSLPPAASGTVGWLLHRLRGVPYAVEYRDPWTVGAFWMADADGIPRTDMVTRWRFRLTRWLEAGLLREAAGSVIVNGEAHIGRLATTFANQTAGKPIAHVRNGVDLEDVRSLSREPANSAQLTLLHTGFFYHFYTPHHLITALRFVQCQHPEALDGVKLEFMGGGFPRQLVCELERWGLGDAIQLTGAGSYSEALSAIHRADGLIAVLPPLDSDRDRIPTKIYEYLSTNRPILAVAHPAGALAKLLDGVPAVVVADNGDQAAIADGFAAFVALARRQRAEGYPAESTRRGDPHDYGERAECMSAFLHQILDSKRES
jgi:glycosyltransferase involved in cell wall biosynthesis